MGAIVDQFTPDRTSTHFSLGALLIDSQNGTYFSFVKNIRQRQERYIVLAVLSDGILSIGFLRVKHLIHQDRSIIHDRCIESANGQHDKSGELTSHREAGKMCLLR